MHERLDCHDPGMRQGMPGSGDSDAQTNEHHDLDPTLSPAVVSEPASEEDVTGTGPEDTLRANRHPVYLDADKRVTKRCEAFRVEIHMAGDYREAVQAAREFFSGHVGCVSIVPATYVYSGGCEEGVRVTIINYPRRPRSAHEIWRQAWELARHLMVRLQQGSFTVEMYDGSGATFHSRRQDDLFD